MNINALTEKAIAEQMGSLMLENMKLKALVSALSTENTALKSRVAETGKTNAAGDSNGHIQADSGGA